MVLFISYRAFGIQNKDPLTLADFLSGVGQLKFRGTSVLFRLPHSIIDNYALSWKYNLKNNSKWAKKQKTENHEQENGIKIYSHYFFY